ncbi:MAG: NfeD family protein [Bacteroidota bacterium]
MKMLVFIGSFDLFTLTEKLLWSLAVVSTILLLILGAMSFFGYELEQEQNKTTKWPWLDAKSILLFFAFFGWSSILAHLWEESIGLVIIYGIPIGLLAAFAPQLLNYLRSGQRKVIASQSNFNLEDTLTSTGEVLQYIPPHIKGRGTVHLNLRNAPYQINAVSQNGELPAGVPVRVVAIMDDQTIVVEPIDGRPPHSA